MLVFCRLLHFAPFIHFEGNQRTLQRSLAKIEHKEVTCHCLSTFDFPWRTGLRLNFNAMKIHDTEIKKSRKNGIPPPGGGGVTTICAGTGCAIFGCLFSSRR